MVRACTEISAETPQQVPVEMALGLPLEPAPDTVTGPVAMMLILPPDSLFSLLMVAPVSMLRLLTDRITSPARPRNELVKIVPLSNKRRDGVETVSVPASPPASPADVNRLLGLELASVPDTDIDCVALMLTSPPRPRPELTL